ncbi:hypothetical protein HL657_00010 [Methanoculleus sp. YWC-01]|uniref:Uncharacterized protein n=1 Tax=Methanoculleus nereidis TaxID=2735141 RepID=A0ABU3YYG3_9EURY|nr:hypothetical protein [Methanoculleus sp. YWC-01]MDV4341583.1 hypothetical protein [Methanoculleus sp. YWC-01]
MAKGGSAFIPTLKGGVFPLRTLHPRKIKIREHVGVAVVQAGRAGRRVVPLTY